MAIARWVTKDGADPKMGVLSPSIFENVDCLLWVQVRDWIFISLPCILILFVLCCGADALRRRRPQIHLRITRQPR